MAITTEALFNTALAKADLQRYYKPGAAPNNGNGFVTPWYVAGNPLASALSASGLSGATIDGTTKVGAIPFKDAGAGLTKMLAGYSGVSNQAGNAFLIDRMWDNSGIVVTTTTAQTINSVAWPARDAAGSTNGEDVLIALEVGTATTNAAAITGITVSYTNSAGTAGRVATLSANSGGVGFPLNAKVGTFCIFALQAGDTGVRSIQSITLGTSLVTGAVSLVAFRVLGVAGYMGGLVQLSWQETNLAKCYNGTCPQVMLNAASTTAPLQSGTLAFLEG